MKSERIHEIWHHEGRF